jgi:hypothetical protein
MRQLITPNPNIPCQPGWCLQYVRQAFGLPARHPTATAAWEASTSKHRDRNFPAGVWLPVWFSLANEPAGHVALMAPDGSVYSTSDLGSVPHQHLDLSDLMNYYARYGMTLTYLGWTEDVAGYPVLTTSTLAAQGDIKTPQEDELSAADVERIINEVNAANEAKHVMTRKAISDARDSVNFNTQKNVEAVGRVTQQLIIDNASPADIAASIPAGIAQQVADELAKRLVK